jgi:sulfatase maturation enzyme AslB (radical SAM superfamily)
MDYTFKAEEKEILECYLEADLFKEEKTFKYLNTFYKSPGTLQPSLDLQRGIELIIRPQCNQKCEYCYITRYGTDLYPLHTRISNEEICNRIDRILDWVFNTKGVFINRWELFAGDLFYDDLAFDIFDVFYNRVLEIYN